MYPFVHRVIALNIGFQATSLDLPILPDSSCRQLLPDCFTGLPSTYSSIIAALNLCVEIADARS